MNHVSFGFNFFDERAAKSRPGNDFLGGDAERFGPVITHYLLWYKVSNS